MRTASDRLRRNGNIAAFLVACLLVWLVSDALPWSSPAPSTSQAPAKVTTPAIASCVIPDLDEVPRASAWLPAIGFCRELKEGPCAGQAFAAWDEMRAKTPSLESVRMREADRVIEMQRTMAGPGFCLMVHEHLNIHLPQSVAYRYGPK